MDALFNRLLIEIQTKVAAALPYVPATRIGIAYVDQDLGQADVYDIKPDILMPALLIDFNVPQYEQKQFKVQWGNLIMSAQLIFDPYHQSSSLQAQAIKEMALVYYETENKLYTIFQDWTANGLLMKPFRRISAVSEKNDLRLRKRNIVFGATYEDKALQKLQP
jgi:hypothetical protein